MADSKISALAAVTSLDGTEEFAVNQGGTSKKATAAQVKSIINNTTPTVVSVGTEFHSTGVPTATLPGTHALNDILLLILQCSNESNITAPTGYKQVGAQNGIGTAATAGSVKLSIFWKRDGGSESAPTIPDTGDHTYGVMIAIRGCPTTGDPFRVLGHAWKFATSTTGTASPGRTAHGNSLILNIFGHAQDTAGGVGSSPTNTSLSSVTEQFDGSTTDGTGGGVYVISGILANAGEFTASTVTWAGTSVDVSVTLAFVPSDAAPMDIQTQSVVFIGSNADLDDQYQIPNGAKSLFVQICDGGGSGSGGNTTTTAEGGGGGGGGGYDEAWYDVQRDLGQQALVTVHAGKGGAAGTALNQAGNAGVVSQFAKGGTGPLISTLRIAGTAATAAASADGGNGGGGSGRGQTAVAVQTTRLDAWGVNASRPSCAQGAAGGSGTTATVGGGNADWGGGGGESGGDTDAAIASASNGFSVRGGGGGGGGRTDTTVATGGNGGGGATGATQGAAGAASNKLPFGGGGGVGGGSSVVTGGTGGFPGGGGGGGAGVAGGFGGAGGHGCVVVTAFF